MSNGLIIQADALPWLDQMAETAPASFDFIFTDPPYWTLDKWRNVGTTTRLGGHRDPSKQRDELWFEYVVLDKSPPGPSSTHGNESGKEILPSTQQANFTMKTFCRHIPYLAALGGALGLCWWVLTPPKADKPGLVASHRSGVASKQEQALLWAIRQVEAWPGDENREGKAGEQGPWQISPDVLERYRQAIGNPDAPADESCALWHLRRLEDTVDSADHLAGIVRTELDRAKTLAWAWNPKASKAYAQEVENLYLLRLQQGGGV